MTGSPCFIRRNWKYGDGAKIWDFVRQF